MLTQLLISLAIMAIMLPPFSILTAKLTRQWNTLPQIIYSQNELRYLEVFLRRDLQSTTSITPDLSFRLLNGDQIRYILQGQTLSRQLTRTTAGKTTITTASIAKNLSITQFQIQLIKNNLISFQIKAGTQMTEYQLFLPNAL